MSTSTGLSLTDFTAYELPPEKWMNLVSPKMRLRVRGKNQKFISSVVKVEGQRSWSDAEMDKLAPCTTHWPWSDDERFPRPSFANDEAFEIIIERRFLLWYKRIRRTKPVTIAQVRTNDHDFCSLSLYDGQHPAGELEHKIKIGEITFTLSRDW